MQKLRRNRVLVRVVSFRNIAALTVLEKDVEIINDVIMTRVYVVFRHVFSCARKYNK